MSVTDPPNQQQAHHWNAVAGPTWVEMQDITDRMLAPFEARLTQRAFPGVGRRVLDVGCGAGATTLAMARRLGPDGLCLGVDISAPLVAAAKARAETEGLRGAAFIEADAQTQRFDAGVFDAVISRFGVMFFDDPVAAFANLRAATAPGGRLTFMAWRSPAENPFFVTAAMALAPFAPPPAPMAPDAPGQFAFADEARVRGILDAAGWTDIGLARVDEVCPMRRSDLAAYITRMGPAAVALRDADDTTRARAIAALETAFEPFIDGDMVRVNAACWEVSATKAR